MLYNVQEKKADRFQILTNIHDSKQITAINYGPYDNGYLIIGLNSGYLLAFDVLHGTKSMPKKRDKNQYEQAGIKQVLEVQLTNSPITSITFDPTQLILVGARDQRYLYAVSLIEKKFEYVYLDLGYSSFCTVKLDHSKHKTDLLKKVQQRRVQKRKGNCLNSFSYT